MYVIPMLMYFILITEVVALGAQREWNVYLHDSKATEPRVHLHCYLSKYSRGALRHRGRERAGKIEDKTTFRGQRISWTKFAEGRVGDAD